MVVNMYEAVTGKLVIGKIFKKVNHNKIIIRIFGERRGEEDQGEAGEEKKGRDRKEEKRSYSHRLTIDRARLRIQILLLPLSQHCDTELL